MKDENTLIFVVHKHAATRLHYDFRLEVDGVLKSWAVPKGPSTNPQDKRLAIMVDDHNLEYANFQGVIPKGQYGAGTVEIWDKGTYFKLDAGKSESIAQAIKNGLLKIFLKGKKLHGAYVLTRIKGSKKNNNWLLIKSNE